MEMPIHVDIIHSIPKYSRRTAGRDRLKIGKMMGEFGYDVEYVENISDEFCRGWDAARDIIVQMLSNKYWEERNKPDGQWIKRDSESRM